jgi:hypothetical protein
MIQTFANDYIINTNVCQYLNLGAALKIGFLTVACNASTKPDNGLRPA